MKNKKMQEIQNTFQYGEALTDTSTVDPDLEVFTKYQRFLCFSLSFIPNPGCFFRCSHCTLVIT